MEQRLVLMHQAMLADRPRVEAYDRALRHAVNEGDVVADAGAGLLVLSMLALRHGAGHVYAVEADPQVARVAAAIADRNGLAGRLTVVAGDARTVRLPVKADVCVSEMMGNLGPEEQMMQVLGTFARHNLRPGGRLVPERMGTRLAAIEFDGEGWGLWGDYLGYRLDAVQEYAEPTAQLHFFQRPPRLLAQPAAVAAGKSRALTITRTGCLQAVAGYFSATLVPGVTLSNFPSYPGCNWAVWVWPLRHTPVAAGDTLHLTLQPPDSERLVTAWKLECSLRRKGQP